MLVAASADLSAGGGAGECVMAMAGLKRRSLLVTAGLAGAAADRRALAYEPPSHADVPAPTVLAQAGGGALPGATAPAPAASAARGPWLQLAPFPVPSEELLGAASNGKLYVFAGLAPGFRPRALVYEYDPAADRWSERRPMPLASHHVALVEHRGKIYAFGGFTFPEAGPPGWVPVDTAWQYDPTADAWRALAPMPSQRGAAAAVVVGDRIFVVGGAGLHPGSAETAIVPGRPHRSVSTVEEYDPATNTWRARAAMPTARNHHAIGAAGGRIYAIGGRVGAAFMTSASNTDLVEEYDPTSDSWGAVRARMPTPRSAVAWGTHGGRIYVAGGEFQDARMSAAYRAVEAYEPATNRWFVVPSMTVARHGLAGCVIGDRLHLVSGDVQSAGTGLVVGTPLHEALQLDVIPH